jgi:hypothetical protein
MEDIIEQYERLVAERAELDAQACEARWLKNYKASGKLNKRAMEVSGEIDRLMADNPALFEWLVEQVWIRLGK